MKVIVRQWVKLPRRWREFRPSAPLVTSGGCSSASCHHLEPLDAEDGEAAQRRQSAGQTRLRLCGYL